LIAHRRFRTTAVSPVSLVSLAPLVARALAAVVFVSPLAVHRVAFAQSTTAGASGAANATESRKAFMDGEREARAGRWETAAERYAQSNAAAPTSQALSRLANAQYQLGHVTDAYQSYAELVKTYGDKLGPAKAAADARLKELAAKTGLLELKISESGASVAIDGKSFGQSPLAAPLRLVAGPHAVKVTKEGFASFDKSIEVQGGRAQPVDIALTREATKGTISVREKTAQAVRVLVDGLDVGPAPWSGEVQPGPHEIAVRGAGLYAAPQKVDVAKGQKQELELVAFAATARLEVKTSDSKGIIFVDGKPVAEGSFRGDVPAGPHVVEVKREGFDPFTKQIDLADKQTYAETVTLKRPGGDVVGPATEGERLLQGIYGGFGVTGVYTVSGLGTELETRCTALGAVTCETPSSYGGGAFGYVGYTWNPVGFEMMLGGLFDGTAQRATFDGTTTSGQNPLLSTPARNERFTLLRFGGLGAIRVRATMQNAHVRGSIAAGLGLSYKMMEMERKATSADGSKLTDVFIPDGKGYLSPAITIDASVQWRLTSTTSLALGILVWAENAGTGTKTAADPNRRMGGDNTAVPIATPEYHLATDAQVFLGPYLGMQFGP
jgi:hypothetical protein